MRCVGCLMMKNMCASSSSSSFSLHLMEKILSIRLVSCFCSSLSISFPPFSSSSSRFFSVLFLPTSCSSVYLTATTTKTDIRSTGERAKPGMKHRERKRKKRISRTLTWQHLSMPSI